MCRPGRKALIRTLSISSNRRGPASFSTPRPFASSTLGDVVRRQRCFSRICCASSREVCGSSGGSRLRCMSAGVRRRVGIARPNLRWGTPRRSACWNSVSDAIEDDRNRDSGAGLAEIPGLQGDDRSLGIGLKESRIVPPHEISSSLPAATDSAHDPCPPGRIPVRACIIVLVQERGQFSALVIPASHELAVAEFMICDPPVGSEEDASIASLVRSLTQACMRRSVIGRATSA